jgi:hypothetical protein
MVILDVATFIGLFPNGESGTGRAPSLHDLSIRPGFGTDPFEEIEDESVNRIGHGYTSWVIPAGLRIAATSNLSPPNRKLTGRLTRARR